jgi:hypothetical protein
MLWHVVSAGLKSLHVRNGTIKFGANFTPFMPVGQLNTIRLTNLRLIVLQDVGPLLPSMEEHLTTAVVFAFGRTTSIHLENCTLEAAFDSPGLCSLTGCMAKQGGKVGL